MKVNNITRLMVACLWCCCTLVIAEDNVKPTIEKPEIVNQIDAKLKVEQERLEQREEQTYDEYKEQRNNHITEDRQEIETEGGEDTPQATDTTIPEPAEVEIIEQQVIENIN